MKACVGWVPIVDEIHSISYNANELVRFSEARASVLVLLSVVQLCTSVCVGHIMG